MEWVYFERFRKACRSSEPKAALDSLIAWLGSCPTQSQSVTVEDFAEQLYDDELAEQLVEAPERLFDGPIGD